MWLSVTDVCWCVLLSVSRCVDECGLVSQGVCRLLWFSVAWSVGECGSVLLSACIDKEGSEVLIYQVSLNRLL